MITRARGKLSTDGDQNVNTVSSRKTKIHESHIGTETTKLRDGLHAIGGVPNHMHVWLISNDRSQSFTKDRVILYAEDPNRIGNHNLF